MKAKKQKSKNINQSNHFAQNKNDFELCCDDVRDFESEHTADFRLQNRSLFQNCENKNHRKLR